MRFVAPNVKQFDKIVSFSSIYANIWQYKINLLRSEVGYNYKIKSKPTRHQTANYKNLIYGLLIWNKWHGEQIVGLMERDTLDPRNIPIKLEHNIPYILLYGNSTTAYSKVSQSNSARVS